MLLSACSAYDIRVSGQLAASRAAPSCLPVVGSTEPHENLDLRWKWDSGPNPAFNQNMSTPMVTDINQDDVSDMVFASFANGAYNSPGILRVVSGADGREIWSYPSGKVAAPTTVVAGTWQAQGSATVAIYDLDRDGKPEILTTSPDGLLILNNQGAVIGRHALSGNSGANAVSLRQAAIQVADADLDGVYEIVVGMAEAGVLYSYDPVARTLSVARATQVLGIMDVHPGSPGKEILTVTEILSASGDVLFPMPLVGDPAAPAPPSLIAFGNFDSEPDTEIVGIHPGNATLKTPYSVSIIKGSTGRAIHTWSEPAAEMAACEARIATSTVYRASSPNVSDVDGDGYVDITFASACFFRALKGGPGGLSALWTSPTRDFSSNRTASSVFDLNGDGRTEVLYNDELNFRIYDGLSGQVLYTLPNDNGTLWENPVVVSLRAGEPASIVLSANSYTRYYQSAFGATVPEDLIGGTLNVTGVRVIQGGDNSWMPTRTLWNEYLYTLVNVTDDLKVPGQLLDFVRFSNRTRANVPKIDLPCI